MVRRIFRIVILTLLPMTVAYFWAFKTGKFPMNPTAFAGIIGLLCAGLMVELVWTLRCFFLGRDRKGTAVARIFITSGLLLSCGGGFTNWLLSLQGFMVITEGEIQHLFQGENLNEFVAGYWSDPNELDIAIALREVELLPYDDNTFFPESKLEVVRGDDEPTILTLKGAELAPFGTLHFHGGAFGFSPRIVILKDEQELFDRSVPFMTQLYEGTGISFEQKFSVRQHGLNIQGTVLLESLNEEMRGHPTLAMELKEKGKVVGAGKLLPGHFADLDKGYRIGFAGMKMWQEIDISRRNYPEPIFIGAGLAALGMLLWIGAVIRRFIR